VNRLTAALVIIIMSAGIAAADERPIILDAEVYVSGDRIVCDVGCDGLLSERIAGTVRSGLPAVIELVYSMEARGGKVVSNGVHSYELLYDVWDDIYSIRSGDSTVIFEDFDAMGGAIERLQRVPIVSVEAADTLREYSVSLTVAVHPLKGSETQRVEGLVSDAVGARSHDSWREQVLNINDLISRFFSRDKGTSNRSDVYRTQHFTPRSLPGAGGSSGGGSGGGGSSGLAIVTVAFEVR
jgi:hypothetical protein